MPLDLPAARRIGYVLPPGGPVRRHGNARASAFGDMNRNIRTIAIHCSRCKCLLYKYHKGGTGSLVKCFVDRIAEDHTGGDLKCPECDQEFARFRMIQNQPAHKIIQGKVFTRGMRRK